MSWVCGWASGGSASLEVGLKCDSSFFSVEGSPASPLTSPGPLTPRRYLSPRFQQTQGRLPLEQWSHGLPWRLHPYLSLPSNSSFRQVPGHLALVTRGVPVAGTAPAPPCPPNSVPVAVPFAFVLLLGEGCRSPGFKIHERSREDPRESWGPCGLTPFLESAGSEGPTHPSPGESPPGRPPTPCLLHWVAPLGSLGGRYRVLGQV